MRLHERHLHDDPPTARPGRRLRRRHRRATSTPARCRSRDARSVVGVAGTVTTLAAALLDLPVYDRDAIDRRGARRRRRARGYVERLVAMTVAERRALPSMHPGRADVIGAGALILVAGAAPVAGVDDYRGLRGRHPRRHRLVAGGRRMTLAAAPGDRAAVRRARCRPGTGWPGRPGRRRRHPVARTPAAVRRLAADRRPRRARRPGQRLLGLPAAGRVARGRRRATSARRSPTSPTGAGRSPAGARRPPGRARRGS